MAAFKIDTSTAIVILVAPPVVKLKNKRTGEMAQDAETGAKLMNVSLAVTDDGESSLYTVAIPEPGIAEGLTVGMAVSPVALKAREWENDYGHGLSFRAVALTAAEFPVAASNGKG